MAVTGASGAQGGYGAQQTQGTQQSKGTKQDSMQLGDGLGKESFLQLLVTQMRYQDPLSPAKDTEYLAQLAQFNALEQMQNLNDKIDKMIKWSQMVEASSLIGKTVDAVLTTASDSGNSQSSSRVSGVVKEIRFVDGQARLVVGNDEVTMGDVVRIYATAAAAAQAVADQAKAVDSGQASS